MRSQPQDDQASVDLAKRIRIHVLRMANSGESSHTASALSIADILATLYGGVLRVDSRSPTWPDRDRFILSKGHAGSAVYAALAERGFFPTQKLMFHCQDGSELSGHLSHKGLPGVELSTGSLGHGLSVAAGMAYAAALTGKSHRVFALLSDGECDEGSIWEAAMFAGHHKLTNLVAIVDYNKIQSLGTVSQTMELEPFADKWTSFGWNVSEIDGHNHEHIRRELTANYRHDKPLAVIAHTTKGKGVSFMENTVLWHYRTPQGHEFTQALVELEAS